MSTAISIDDQIPGHTGAGMKLLFEAPLLLGNGFNAKNIANCLKGFQTPDQAATFTCTNSIASSIGRNFGDLLRSTHNAYQQNVEEAETYQQPSTATWSPQIWEQPSWGWNQGHGDHMGHTPVGAYGTSA